MQFRYGCDLITFYHPSFWGVETWEAFENLAAQDRRAFWNKIVEAVNSCDVTGIELTFGPGSWQAAKETFGSAEGFAEFIGESGLSVISGFFDGLEITEDLTDPDAQQRILTAAAEYSAFLKACGAEILVAGMPMRKKGSPDKPSFVDFDYAKRVADITNRVAAAAISEGVRLALHPEVGSVFCVRRDIQLFMSLTDPAFVDFCPDTGHIFLGGVSPVEILADHYERVTLAHWKDAVGRWPNDDQSNEDRFALEAQYFKRVGLGNVDWRGWITGMEKMQFNGWAILELDTSPSPVEDTTAAREFVENLASS